MSIKKEKKKGKKKQKAGKRAKDFGDNPKIRRGRDAATASESEPWEVQYVKKKRKFRL